MATLEKIRSKGVLLLVIVGLAMLAFIIGDFLNSGATYFNQSHENAAEINGEKVHVNDYQASIDQMTEVYKIETGQSDLNEDLTAQLRASVWETMVSEKLIQNEADKLGLTITADELSDHIIGNNIHPIIMQRRVFYDENGRFSRPALIQFINSLDAEPANAEQAEQIKQAKTYWLFWENTVRSSMLQEKYVALLSKAVTANSLDAKMSFEGRKTSADVAYTMQPYFALPDSAVTVSDNEVKTLYNKRKAQMKQEPNRSISYLCFEVQPSEEDFKEAEAWINKLKPEFDTTDDVASVVNSNSDIPYTGRAYSAETVPAELKDFAFSGKAGDVTPITLDKGIYRTARIMQTGIMTPDSVKLSHIYLPENNQQRADSIMAAIKAGADFGAMAKQYSAVKQTADNNGEIGWVYENAIDKEVADKAFSKGVNEMFTVSNPQGVQIFRITDRSAATPKVKLAVLERKVTASSRTTSTIYNDAKQFAATNTAARLFVDAAKEQKLNLQQSGALLKSTDRVANLKLSRQIVRWAFEAKENAVSDVFECGDCFVVAALTEVNDDDYRSLADATPELKAELIRDKKAEKMIADIKAIEAKNNTLAGVAEALHASVDTATMVNMATYSFGKTGMEPYVIGKATTLEAGKLSEPVKGNMGVFVLQAGAKQETPATYDQKSEVMQLNMRSSYALPYAAVGLLREEADIVDNRSAFY